MKETWNIINQLINKQSKTTKISAVVVEDTCLTKNNEIADSMNDYFCSIGEKLSSNIPSTENLLFKSNYSLNENHERFHFKMTRAEKPSKIANKFKTSHSCGLTENQAFSENWDACFGPFIVDFQKVGKLRKSSHSQRWLY